MEKTKEPWQISQLRNVFFPMLIMKRMGNVVQNVKSEKKWCNEELRDTIAYKKTLKKIYIYIYLFI